MWAVNGTKSKTYTIFCFNNKHACLIKRTPTFDFTYHISETTKPIWINFSALILQVFVSSCSKFDWNLIRTRVRFLSLHSVCLFGKIQYSKVGIGCIGPLQQHVIPPHTDTHTHIHTHLVHCLFSQFTAQPSELWSNWTAKQLKSQSSHKQGNFGSYISAN